MDPRRLDTAGVIASGILGIPAPTTGIPEDRETVSASGENYEGFIGVEAVVAAVEAGNVVSASNYYGIPSAWRASEGVYRGTLLQYRAITEDPTFATVDELAEWFEEKYHETYG